MLSKLHGQILELGEIPQDPSISNPAMWKFNYIASQMQLSYCIADTQTMCWLIERLRRLHFICTADVSNV